MYTQMCDLTFFFLLIFLDALTQAEKDTGSLKNSGKANSRQGRKKQMSQKTKINTPSSSQSPRQEKDKHISGKSSKNTSRKL